MQYIYYVWNNELSIFTFFKIVPPFKGNSVACIVYLLVRLNPRVEVDRIKTGSIVPVVTGLKLPHYHCGCLHSVSFWEHFVDKCSILRKNKPWYHWSNSSPQGHLEGNNCFLSSGLYDLLVTWADSEIKRQQRVSYLSAIALVWKTSHLHVDHFYWSLLRILLLHVDDGLG